MSGRRRIALIAILAASAFPSAYAQADRTAFSIYVENDAFSNSDTGYTNGIRLTWSIKRDRPGMRVITGYNLATALNGVLGAHLFGVRRLTLDFLRLDKLGFIPDSFPAPGRAACPASLERASHKSGACVMLNLGLAQVMYTPDSLASTRVQPRDQPYAGFLYANFGVTTLDSPVKRHPTNWLSYTEVSNQVLVGVTGQAAHADDTQAIAHWTWSTGSHRPLGWSNQLRQSVQLGLLTDMAFRTKRAMEFCKYGCSGREDEGRWLDFTPHVEGVTSTHMVRLSGGGTVRLGAHFPDAIGTLRIPVTVPMGGRADCFAFVVCERYWWYLFGNAEARYVPYNMFIEGGIADGGPNGWRTIRQISPRRNVNEVAGGFAFGNSRMTMRAQMAARTAEYDVVGFGRSKGWHGFGSLLFSVHPNPD